MRNLLLLTTICLTFFACSRKILVQDAFLSESDRGIQQDVRVQTTYAGDAYSYITFQLDITNNSSDSIRLSQRDVELVYDIDRGRNRYLKPIRKADIILDLVQAEEILEAEKKQETISAGVVTGIGILTSVLAGGSVVDNVVYGAASTADIMVVRDRYGLDQGSIEDQIRYHEEYTLEDVMIPPLGKASYDVHFERLLIDGPAEMVVYFGGLDHMTQYHMQVNEVKVRRR